MEVMFRMGGCYFRQPLTKTDRTGTLKAIYCNNFLWGPGALRCVQMRSCAPLQPLAYSWVWAWRRQVMLASKIVIWDDMKLKKWENWTKFGFHIEKKFAWDSAGLFAEKVAIRTDSSDSQAALKVGQQPKEGAGWWQVLGQWPLGYL